MAGLVLAGAAAGCSRRTDRIDALSGELVQREARIATLTDEAASLKLQLAEPQRQIRTLQGLGERRLENLFRVDRIRLGRYTGGYAEPGAQVDAGVRVYLKCIDTAGDTIKAAGDVTVQLFDLAGREPVRIGEYAFGVEDIEKHWYAGPLTYHYRFDCPWPDGAAPAHEEVTVRVVFVDYLTGGTFSVQRVVPVALDGDR